MTLHRIITGLLAACVLAAPVAAEQLPLNAISRYLNSFQTARSDFTQVNDDGTLSRGTLFMKRPGRVRFEYSGRNAAKVIAGQGSVVIHDPKSNQPPESYPLRRTPLSIILAERVDLGRAQMVVGHDYDGTATRVRAQDPEHPEYGSIDMYFTDSPVELRKWVINDGNGGQTTVILGGIQTNLSLANSLFNTVTPSAIGDR
ncbi:MAG: outer membrane lipoprotein carrier protein LolA [Paracoccaceae bacterium]